MTFLTRMSGEHPYWRPDVGSAASSQMARFLATVARDVPSAPRADAPYNEWHTWSVDDPAAFWAAVWKTCGVISETAAEGEAWKTVLRGGERMAPPDAEHGPMWFEGARLNFAENLLRRRDDAPAIIWRGEDGRRTEVTFAQLHARAGAVAAALSACGVQPGDRVAGYLPNIPEAVIAMLGAAWIGAVWSSCSPDFGVSGVIDRFGQIQPKVLVAADGYRYDGKAIDLTDRLAEIVKSLPSVQHLVVVPFLRESASLSAIPRAHSWAAFTATNATPPPHVKLSCHSHLYVLYSSGTTGLPKCLVHSVGGTLLQHLKEHRLHVDLRAGERIFYFTTCGWMMWNWLVSALASEATIVLYDGAPMPKPNPAVLWDLAAEERVAVFGTSAKYLALSEKAGVAPAKSHDLSQLRSILSTGSPLAPASFDYIARDVKPGVHVGSISGGTDIISCFALSNPMLPVWRGELQCLGLGMAVEIFDEHGRPLRDDDGNPLTGVPGELVCTRPFPSMPIAVWNDPDGRKYHDTYFSYFSYLSSSSPVWRHGDWVELTEHGGLIIHGRSDATLNPGGVRIGTAELYREVEQIPEIVEAVAIGQELSREPGADVRVVLFVRLRDGVELDDALVARIRRQIRDGASPHHVPKLVLAVSDIPRTVSGKITEMAIREAFHGRPVKNTAAMANPGALDEFRRLGAEHRASIL